jgi:hypothetical protein
MFCCWVLLAALVSKRLVRLRRALMGFTDKRVGLMNEIVNSMQVRRWRSTLGMLGSVQRVPAQCECVLAAGPMARHWMQSPSRLTEFCFYLLISAQAPTGQLLFMPLSLQQHFLADGC